MDSRVEETSGLDRYGRRLIKSIVLMNGINLSVLLLAAGSWTWWYAWALCGATLAAQTTFVVILGRRDPRLLNERGKFVKKDTKGFDRVFLALYFPTVFVSLIVAALDSGRFGWSHVPIALTVTAYGVLLPAYVLALWAMLSNTHFEATVRIQEDREHKVCTTGPYHYVRHPGYVAGVLVLAALPLLLGSLWAYVPAGFAAAIMIARTVLEDRMLRAELNGYQEYAQQVRFRLIPGVW